MHSAAAHVQPVLQALADLFFPRTCAVCGRHLGRRERRLCLHCDLDLPLTYFWMQERNAMADKFNALIQKRLDRQWETPEKEIRAMPGRHPAGHEPYARAAALFYYNASAGFRRIPQAIKSEGAVGLGRYFGRRLGTCLKEAAPYRDVTHVVPVPLHWTRQWERGYNQAAVIAREIAAVLNVPCEEKLLYRRRRTRSQTLLAPEEKAANVDGAFAVRSTGKQAVQPTAAVHILLVDDVFTTGATLEACHAALRKAFPDSGPHRLRISVATLACVGTL